jgi:hypothetical protein
MQSDSLLQYASVTHRYFGVLVATGATVGTRGTRAVATSPDSSDGPSDINDPLLLAPTVVMGFLISEAHCYCGGTWYARGCY